MAAALEAADDSGTGGRSPIPTVGSVTEEGGLELPRTEEQ
jgi:hypothetical protein